MARAMAFGIECRKEIGEAMLDKVDLDQRLAKQEYKAKLPAIQARLYALEWACWKQGIPTAILFEAWGGAGKGEVIKLLTEKLDPRGYQVIPVVPPNTEEAMKPWMARFWEMIPARGEMAVFDRSWYGRVLWDRFSGEVGERRLIQAYQDIREFEAMLAADGTLFVKLWLHMSKKRQAARLKKMAKDPMTAWKVSESDWWQNKHYQKVVKALEQMLEQTSTEYAPWTIVEMEDEHFGRIKVLETVAGGLTSALVSRGAELPPEALAARNSEKTAEDRTPGKGKGGEMLGRAMEGEPP